MKRGPVPMLVAGLVIIAAVVMGVSLVFAAQLSRQDAELDGALAEVQNLTERLRAVEMERDGLRERVAALEAALIAAGVDPKTIPAEPSALPEPGSTTPPESSTAAPQAPAGRSDSPSRPAEQGPQNPPQNSEPPPEQPPPPPPQDDPDPPGPLPPVTCRLPVLGPPLCS